MKRSEINEKKEEFQQVVESVKSAILNLLDSEKNNGYTIHEIIKAVMKDFAQRKLEIGNIKEKIEPATITATVKLTLENYC